MRISDWSSDVCSSDLKDRFDFWHALFPHIDMRRTVGEGGYRAAALACAGDDGIAFTDLVCAPTASRFHDGRVDHMQLCILVAGQFHLTHAHDERVSPSSDERRVGKEGVSTCISRC